MVFIPPSQSSSRAAFYIGWKRIPLTKPRCLRVALWNAICAGIFGWCTLVLPVSGGGRLQWIGAMLTLAHLLVAGLSLAQIVRPHCRGLRETGILMAGTSCLAAIYILYSLASTAQHLMENYGQLGRGLSVALALFGLLALGLTVPSALYWLRLNSAAPKP